MRIGVIWIMTRCCRICSKLLCENYGQIEDCPDCVSYVWLAMQEIDKIQKELEGGQTRVYQISWKKVID